jgi:hypothetical protein
VVLLSLVCGKILPARLKNTRPAMRKAADLFKNVLTNFDFNL